MKASRVRGRLQHACRIVEVGSGGSGHAWCPLPCCLVAAVPCKVHMESLRCDCDHPLVVALAAPAAAPYHAWTAAMGLLAGPTGPTAHARVLVPNKGMIEALTRYEPSTAACTDQATSISHHQYSKKATGAAVVCFSVIMWHLAVPERCVLRILFANARLRSHSARHQPLSHPRKPVEKVHILTNILPPLAPMQPQQAEGAIWRSTCSLPTQLGTLTGTHQAPRLSAWTPVKAAH
jgi:hypothetical protein